MLGAVEQHSPILVADATVHYVNFPSSQGAVGKRKEFEGMQSQGKVGQAEVTEIGQRTDTLSYALLAEINTFHSQRLKDMKLVHQQFLQEQIKFYQKASIA